MLFMQTKFRYIEVRGDSEDSLERLRRDLIAKASENTRQ